jgi:DNA-directed RNA polymerase specialized sigma24 family protein
MALGSDALIALHIRVLAGDRLAPECMAAIVLASAVRILRKRWQRIDPALVNDAVEDALLKYLAVPGQYDSSLARLDTFIVAVASRRLLTLLRSERRQRRAGCPASAVTVNPEMTIVTDRVQSAFEAILSHSERVFFDARLSGETRTEELAQLIGATGLPPNMQRQLVKRMTERLRIRLRRLGASLDRDAMARMKTNGP